MEAMEILQKIADEIELIYETSEDFMNWIPVNSEIGITHNFTAYCIDYRIIGARRVVSNLTAFRKKYGKWHPVDVDMEEKIFIQSAFNYMLPIWHDELRKKEEAAVERQEDLAVDYRQMQDTYQSLQTQF